MRRRPPFHSLLPSTGTARFSRGGGIVRPRPCLARPRVDCVPQPRLARMQTPACGGSGLEGQWPEGQCNPTNNELRGLMAHYDLRAAASVTSPCAVTRCSRRFLRPASRLRPSAPTCAFGRQAHMAPDARTGGHTWTHRRDYAARPRLDRYESEGLGDEDELGDASDEHAGRLRAEAALDAREQRDGRAQGTGRGRHLPGIIADGALPSPQPAAACLPVYAGPRWVAWAVT